MAEQNKKSIRNFLLSSTAVDNATSVLLLSIMILSFGILAYRSMPKEQFPEITFPQIFINTVYFGNSAEDIENLITRPIEKELQSISGIKEIRSTSLQDYSVIMAEFRTDIPIETALRRVKDAVDAAKATLPGDLDSDPVIEDVNFSEFPIMTINLSGDYSNDRLKAFAEQLQEVIEDLKEISSVEIKGVLDREIKIDLDPYQMASREVSFADVQNAIASENLTMSGGEITANGIRRAVRVIGEFVDAKQMENMIVKSEFGAAVYLKDIAQVSFGYKDRTNYARSDLRPVVSLNVVKRSGFNLLDAADKIDQILQKFKSDIFPENLKVQKFNDQSIHTRDGVSNLENSIISGVILVVLVLLFFLGFRNALFVGIAIPLSMLMGILILNLLGITMNMVVLFALILALGLLVDNGIVVVENIYRFRQEGLGAIEASKRGTAEVAWPIIASTATTLAAFLPLWFWPGLMGEFMKYMPLTLMVVLGSSLFVGLVINPVLTSRFMKLDHTEDAVQKKKKIGKIAFLIAAFLLLAALGHLANIKPLRHMMIIATGFTLINYFLLRPLSAVFQKSFLPALESKYYSFVAWALRWPLMLFIATFLLLIFSIALLKTNMPAVQFFPTTDPLYVNVFVDMPIGTDIQSTNNTVIQLEKKITKAIQPYKPIIEAVLTQIGEDTADPNSPPEPGASPHRGRITVAFVPDKDRGNLSSVDALNTIRHAVKGLPGVQITVDQNQNGPPRGKPINIELSGQSNDQLSLLSEQLIKFINSKNIPGIEELKADVKLGKPELLIKINREAARRFQLSTFSIADAIRTSIFGKEISKYKIGEDEYPIFMRLDQNYKNDISELLNQKITFRNQSNGRIVQIPISAVTDISYSTTYSAIKRIDLDRVITIYSNVLAGYNANEIVEELKTLMKDFDLPKGYKYKFTGEQQQQNEDTGFLMSAFGVALFVIFLIIVTQFNSISSPFIIILSVLFSTIGVFLGYVFTGRDIVIIMTGVGIISLAGIVVNNAIVLIDYINLLITNRLETTGLHNKFLLPAEDVKQAIKKAGATRLRPVLLTAITTILGLIPLAIGFNFNFFSLITDWDPQIFIGGDNVSFWGPMAWTIIYGLLFATFLTLVVVPVMYWLAYGLNKRIKNIGR